MDMSIAKINSRIDRFNTYLDRINLLSEMTFNDYTKSSLYVESENYKLVLEEAKEGLIQKIIRIVKSIKDQIVKIVSDIVNIIRDKFLSVRGKKELNNITKAINSNPKLKGKKVNISNPDKILKAGEETTSEISKIRSKLRSGSISPDQAKKELENIEKKRDKKIKLAKGAVLTIGIMSAIGMLTMVTKKFSNSNSAEKNLFVNELDKVDPKLLNDVCDKYSSKGTSSSTKNTTNMKNTYKGAGDWKNIDIPKKINDLAASNSSWSSVTDIKYSKEAMEAVEQVVTVQARTSTKIAREVSNAVNDISSKIKKETGLVPSQEDIDMKNRMLDSLDNPPDITKKPKNKYGFNEVYGNDNSNNFTSQKSRDNTNDSAKQEASSDKSFRVIPKEELTTKGKARSKSKWGEILKSKNKKIKDLTDKNI